MLCAIGDIIAGEDERLAKELAKDLKSSGSKSSMKSGKKKKKIKKKSISGKFYSYYNLFYVNGSALHNLLW